MKKYVKSAVVQIQAMFGTFQHFDCGRVFQNEAF